MPKRAERRGRCRINHSPAVYCVLVITVYCTVFHMALSYRCALHRKKQNIVPHRTPVAHITHANVLVCIYRDYLGNV